MKDELELYEYQHSGEGRKVEHLECVNCGLYGTWADEFGLDKNREICDECMEAKEPAADADLGGLKETLRMKAMIKQQVKDESGE